MLIAVIVLLALLLVASLVGNVVLFKAAERQELRAELYELWIEEWRTDVLKTHAHMKMLDDKEMFSKDDEVGVVFKDMALIIDSLNNRTQEVEE